MYLLCMVMLCVCLLCLEVAIGRPIKVEKMSPDDEGFEEEAARLHGLFLAGMEETFHACKGLYGWNDMPLRIE